MPHPPVPSPSSGGPDGNHAPVHTLVDLFAGCGGLALGLEQAGFDTIFVNEISEHALATYLANRPDLRAQAADHSIRDITTLTSDKDRLATWANELRDQYGDVSLLTGGPPCQGFSRIGHRRTFQLDKEEIPSNHLYRDMARAVRALGPQAFVFENVAGLLSARWTPAGTRGEIWTDVRDAFKGVRLDDGTRVGARYVLGPVKTIRAADFGVPQNRPRLIWIGLREDVAERHGITPNSPELAVRGTAAAPDLRDVLSDLEDPGWVPGGAMDRYPSPPMTPEQVELRTTPGGDLLAEGAALSEHDYSNHSPRVRERFRRIRDGQLRDEDKTKKFSQRALPARWGDRGPFMTVTSLPDDYVHYSEDRAPTVREWARLQGFPDWYQFRGPRTTGGRRRAGDPGAGIWTRDTPRFTQIGNAVPVKLAEAVGNHLRHFLG